MVYRGVRVGGSKEDMVIFRSTNIWGTWQHSPSEKKLFRLYKIDRF